MIQPLKYGLVTTAGYVILLTVLFALTAWFDGVGISYYYGLITPFYIVLMATGAIVSFLAGRLICPDVRLILSYGVGKKVMAATAKSSFRCNRCRNPTSKR